MNDFDANTYQFTECRDMGHLWGAPRTFETQNEAQSKNVLSLTRRRTCVRCNTDRDEHWIVNRRYATIQRVNSRYIYPEGYRLHGLNVFAVAEQCRYVNLLAELTVEDANKIRVDRSKK